MTKERKTPAMKTGDMVSVCIFSALIAAGAFIRVPIPVCPFTFQTLFVSLAGILLGSKKGAVSAALYMFIGLFGVPVFTGGGGIGYIFKPTFGYIVGFIIGAYITGRIAESGTLSFKRLLAASFAGLAVIYAIGMVYYYLISALWLGTPIGVWELFLYCFLLVVPGDIVLCFAGSALSLRVLPVIKRERY